MRPTTLPAALLVFAALVSSTAPRPLRHRGLAETIAINDNRASAGRLEGKVLRVDIDARVGMWYPEGPGGRGLEVEAFAEGGKTLQNPGPLIRLRSGGTARISIHNSLTRPLSVFGLGRTRGTSDSIIVAPGGTSVAEFTAAEPGTYYYYGKTGADRRGDFRLADDGQLNGAVIVDPVDGPPAPDRIFIISWWFKLDSTSRTGLSAGTMTINGLSWPHTERIEATQGDTLHWRVINLTAFDHPMHLHGFYFRLDAAGDGRRDTLFAADQRRMEVTQVVAPQATMDMTWAPTRPGNWIFHCHYALHISDLSSLDTHKGMLDTTAEMHHPSDAPHQMFGLVLGISVASSGSVVAQGSAQPRHIRLLVRSKPNVYGKYHGYAFVLGGTPAENDPNAMPLPGPPLVLERNQPVAINVVNHAHEPVSIHWHGIELESYPDGVPNWSGAGSNILRPIPPGDSLTIRFAPPRAGTFMYHSHFDEGHQISSGLYGPIIVLDKGQTYDPDRDRVLLLSDGGPTDNVIVGPFPPKLLNGKAQPDPLELRPGVAYRFRIINITDGIPTMMRLSAGEQPIMWQSVAKDGADLPPAQAKTGPAVLISDPGEIYDFAYTPSAPGELSLSFGLPPFIPPPPGLKPTVVPVHVR